jgi:hypothetical protein
MVSRSRPLFLDVSGKLVEEWDLVVLLMASVFRQGVPPGCAFPWRVVQTGEVDAVITYKLDRLGRGGGPGFAPVARRG